MKKILIIISILFLLSFSLVLAHVPFETGEGKSLENATVITEPTKSWVVYEELNQEIQVKYYRLEMNQGERIKLDLFTPVRSEFKPNIIVTGPGIKSEEDLPEGIEIPEGAGFIIVKSNLGEAKYEPFTPASYYYLSDANIPVTETGTYYVGVFDFVNEGKYGLAIGYVEKFSLSEWISIPISVTRIRLWEGQSLVLVLAPIMLTVLFGLIALFLNKKTKNCLNSFSGILIALAGLFYIGSGLSIIHQMAIAFTKATSSSASVTLIFSFIPIILGLIVLSYLNKNNQLKNTDRFFLLILSLLGLVFWAGFIVGPMILVISTLVPIKKSKI